MRWIVVAVASGCSTSPPVCGAQDVDCFMDNITSFDNSGERVPLVMVDSDAVAGIAGASPPQLTSGPSSASFPMGTLIDDGGDVLWTSLLDLAFSDPDGCTPVLALTVKSGSTRSKHTGCFPGARDMRTSGSISQFIGFAASAAAEASLSLEMRLLSSRDCASIDQPAALLTDPTVVGGTPVAIPLDIAPQPNGGGGGGTCPGGLEVSTLACSPIGSSGTGDDCLSAQEYASATGGMPLPAACAPAGTTGCQSESGSTAGVLVKPCCPGLTCKVGAACGDATNTVGGTCE